MATYLKTPYYSQSEIKSINDICGVAKILDKEEIKDPLKGQLVVFRYSISAYHMDSKLDGSWIEATKEEYDELMKIAATNINEANNDE